MAGAGAAVAAAAERHAAPLSGIGIGWRPEIAGVIADLPGLGFCEVVAESVARPAAPPRGVVELRARGVAVVPHGVRLGLGDADGVAPGRVAHLAACARELGAPLVSEHVAFVRAGGREAGHLLPLPRTREALDVLTANVRRTTAELDVPLALEPIAALLDWPDDEYTEGDFLTELLERTGTLLLLDVANVYANARNRGLDPVAVLDRMPLHRVAYVHVAGGSVHPDDPSGLYHDTHLDPVPSPVLDLLQEVRERGAAPAVMLERDGRYPPAAELRTEVAALAPPGSPRIGTPGPPAATSRTSARGVRTARPLPGGQADLVGALLGTGPDPAGFDPVRLDATRRALRRKRAGEAARHWPLLAAGLGPDWVPFAARVLGGRPVAGGLRDGWDVARAARERGRLSDGAARELTERERDLAYDGTSDPRPRPLGGFRRSRARLRRYVGR